MAEPDPESEALIRQLHRELNGLTRSRRTQQPTTSLDFPLPRSRAKPQDRSKLRGSRSNSEDGSIRGAQVDVHGSGDHGGDAGEDETGQPAPKRSRVSKPPISEDKRSSPVMARKSTATLPATGAAAAPAQAANTAAKTDNNTDQVKQVDAGQGKAPTAVPSAALVPAAPAAACTPQQQVQQQQQQQQQPPQPPQPVISKTPLEEAAAAASAGARARTKQAGPVNQAGARYVKCFHAGVRWGIILTPESLKTRSDLATALNDAFAGQILSCGRGEMLSIVFLDHDGCVHEFPPLRNSGQRDSASRWKAMVDKAAKIYVTRY